MGEYRFSVDHKTKLVKCVMSGKFDNVEFEDLCEAIISEAKKFKRGEVLYLRDAANVEMKFFSPSQAKLYEETGKFLGTYCKKTAGIIPSFMYQKTIESALHGDINPNIFATEQEAMKFLLES